MSLRKYELAETLLLGMSLRAISCGTSIPVAIYHAAVYFSLILEEYLAHHAKSANFHC